MDAGHVTHLFLIWHDTTVIIASYVFIPANKYISGHFTSIREFNAWTLDGMFTDLRW